MKVLPIALLVLLLVGCGGSDDVVPIGPDTYMESGSGGMTFDSAADIEMGLYRRANAYCGQQGKVMQPLSQEGTDSGYYRFGHADIQFRCLAASDPEVHRPTMKPVPNAVISVQH